jgi:secreted trypsin-like serine protease
MLGTAVVVFGSLTDALAIRHKPPQRAVGFPEAVVITAGRARDPKAARCTGALIAPRAVLTAAHCVVGFDSWEVLAPSARGGPVCTTSRDALAHPRFKENPAECDVAVIRLQDDIALDGKYPRIYNGDPLPLETRLTVIGSVDNGKPPGTTLYRADVTLVPFPDNVNVYGGNPRVADHGDSGGPVYVEKGEIVAVISGHTFVSQRDVAKDLYVPIHGKIREWVLRQVPDR